MFKRIIALTTAVAICFMPTTAIGSPDSAKFADIQGHWAESVIVEASQANLMQGTGKNEQGKILFAPSGLVSRAQAASALTGVFKIDYGNFRFVKEPQASDYFNDVANNAWYAPAATLSALHDIFDNYPEVNQFYPDLTLSRLDMARAIQRCFTVKNINIPMIMLMPSFNDTANISAQDMNAIVFVHNTGIMKGNNGSFRPHAPLTRAELAQILVACERIMDMQTESDLPEGIPLFVKLINERGEYMDVDLQIPLIEEKSKTPVQALLNTRFETEANKFRQEVASTLDDYVRGSKLSGYPINKYQALSRIQEGCSNQQYLSLYIDYYSYTGGAHGFTDRRAYNFDMQTGKELTLADLFQPGYDYKKVINQAIKEQISRHEGDFFEGDRGFTGINEQQPFYIKDGQLVVYFGLYEIAPYAAGIQEFKIPLGEMGDNLTISF
ncbi:S-layer homology domain [Syntrophomonas zehnderi OL-4]|uniref:S-layer homology domain n=1 Tax=Syntrophomonas zehnderi OL-4 TaxID=690567 RepID=A0A0E4GC21_9FIRM|nr:S-layer homology domain-containing protein [Syntrophomonas zehnderi]CFY07259.1 S-layer homology domain [Syntrophomonas zehnderi OL-4]